MAAAKSAFEPEFEFVLVTEKMAEEWLKNAAPNRPLSEATVAEHTRIHLDGKWKFNGATISFDPDGKLIDGRHRLTGYLGAKRQDPALPPFATLVVRGVKHEAVLTIDVGRRRTLADHIAIQGGVSGFVLGASLRRLAAFAWPSDRLKLSVDELLGILERHPHVTDSVKKARALDLVSRSTLAAIHYVGAYVQMAKDDADAFLDVFRTGRPSYEGCPAHRVREVFLRLRTTKRTMMTTEHQVYLIHAWNLFRDHRSIVNFKTPNVVVLEGWTPDVCFGVGSTLAVRATEAVRAARAAASAAERLTKSE